MTEVDDSLIELPSGWVWTTLERISEKINPGFPSGKHNKENRGIPHIRPMNISVKGEIDLSNVKYVEVSDYEPLLNGDVLFNNTNSPEMLGKTTFLKQNTNWAYSNHMTRIRLFQQFLEPAWVAYYLHNLFLNGFFKMNCVHHVNQASINSGFLSQKVLIPLAPFPEQRHIVSKIEELFSRLDAGIEALQKAKAQLRRYRQAVLKAAVEGKLTEEWRKAHPEVEPAERLLKRVRSKKWNGGKSELELSNLPGIPNEWVWVNLGEIGNVSGGLTKNSKRDSYPLNLPYLRVANVYAGELRLDEMKKIGLGENELERVLLNPGDLLVVEGNGSQDEIGRVALWDGSISPCVHQNHIIKVRFNPSSIGKYILYWLLSTSGREQIGKVASSTSGLYTLSISKVASLLIPLPSLLEQEKIVEEIEYRLSIVEEENLIDLNILKGYHLRQSILKRAFEGKLVPQDPSDEPASMLIKRIKAEKGRVAPIRGRKNRNNSAGQMRLIQ